MSVKDPRGAAPDGGLFEIANVPTMIGFVLEQQHPDEDVVVLAYGQCRKRVLAVLGRIGREHGDPGVTKRRLEELLEERGNLGGGGIREPPDRDREQSWWVRRASRRCSGGGVVLQPGDRTQEQDVVTC
jgi:hypothetical protein